MTMTTRVYSRAIVLAALVSTATLWRRSRILDMGPRW